MRPRSLAPIAIVVAAFSGLAAGPASAAVKFSRDVLKGTTKTQGDFNLSSRFSLEIDGVTIGGIHRIDGLLELLFSVYEEGGKNEAPRAVALQIEPAATASPSQLEGRSVLAEMVCGAIAGKTDRKSISVIFHNDAGDEISRVLFVGAKAVSWEPHKAPGLDLPEQSRNSGHATESMTISFENVEFNKK